jgi:UDP-3-O-[3-hydroxymyristoyl] glucosamine N-acyltransferase
MADPRFFSRVGPFKLGYLAERVGVRLVDPADAEIEIVDVDALDTAGPNVLSFYADRRYRGDLETSKAAVIVIAPEHASLAPAGATLVLAGDAHRQFARIAEIFYPRASPEPAIDSAATVERDAVIAEGCRIEAGARIGARAELGAGCHIRENAVIGEGVVLGEWCEIGAGVTVSHAILGKRVVILPGAQIGQPGFGFVPGPEGVTKVLQLGRVLIGDDVEIGANCTIDRGAAGDTVIGPSTMIDNLVQIGHNVQIGRGCILVAQVGVSGSTRLGDYVVLGGQVGVAGHLSLGDGVRVAAQGGVARDVEPGGVMGGSPAVPVRQWHRQSAVLARLAKEKGS